MPVPQKYGSVVIRNFSGKAGLKPVRFEHWLHRSLYTCRLCHVDIGFAMQANATEISAETNQKGFYCGACHNGTRTFSGRTIFSSCSLSPSSSAVDTCDRCHSAGMMSTKRYDYEVFATRLPKRLGYLIDWEAAEARGLIRPVDILDGISMQRTPLSAQKDFSITSKSTWMPDIIFSHRKHALWNGCEVCHPEIFPSTKKGTVKYSMLQISDGQYCGLCHGRVAFPLNDCQQCHIDPVRQ